MDGLALLGETETAASAAAEPDAQALLEGGHVVGNGRCGETEVVLGCREPAMAHDIAKHAQKAQVDILQIERSRRHTLIIIKVKIQTTIAFKQKPSG